MSEKMEQLEGLHACYLKQWWCCLQMFLYFKHCYTLCNVVTLVILAISIVMGSVWKESFPMVGLTAAAALVKGWSDFKRFTQDGYVSICLHNLRKDFNRTQELWKDP